MANINTSQISAKDQITFDFIIKGNILDLASLPDDTDIQFISTGLQQDVKKLFEIKILSPKVTHPNAIELQNILSRKQKNIILLKTLASWFCEFHMYKNLEGIGINKVFDSFLNKNGSCIVQTIGFIFICQYLHIPARVSQNNTHTMPEISPDGGLTWYLVELNYTNDVSELSTIKEEVSDYATFLACLNPQSESNSQNGFYDGFTTRIPLTDSMTWDVYSDGYDLGLLLKIISSSLYVVSKNEITDKRYITFSLMALNDHLRTNTPINKYQKEWDSIFDSLAYFHIDISKALKLILIQYMKFLNYQMMEEIIFPLLQLLQKNYNTTALSHIYLDTLTLIFTTLAEYNNDTLQHWQISHYNPINKLLTFFYIQLLITFSRDTKLAEVAQHIYSNALIAILSKNKVTVTTDSLLTHISHTIGKSKIDMFEQVYLDFFLLKIFPNCSLSKQFQALLTNKQKNFSIQYTTKPNSNLCLSRLLSGKASAWAEHVDTEDDNDALYIYFRIFKGVLNNIKSHFILNEQLRNHFCDKLGIDSLKNELFQKMLNLLYYKFILEFLDTTKISNKSISWLSLRSQSVDFYTCSNQISSKPCVRYTVDNQHKHIGSVQLEFGAYNNQELKEILGNDYNFGHVTLSYL